MKSQSTSVGALSKDLLLTDSQGASTTYLGSLFQCLTMLTAQKCFPKPSQTLPWQLCAVLPLMTRSRAHHLPLLFWFREESCREATSTSWPPLLQTGQPNVLSTFSQDIPSNSVTSLLPSSGGFWGLQRPFSCCGAQNCMQYSRWGCTNTKYSRRIKSQRKLQPMESWCSMRAKVWGRGSSREELWRIDHNPYSHALIRVQRGRRGTMDEGVILSLGRCYFSIFVTLCQNQF